MPQVALLDDQKQNASTSALWVLASGVDERRSWRPGCAATRYGQGSLVSGIVRPRVGVPGTWIAACDHGVILIAIRTRVITLVNAWALI